MAPRGDAEDEEVGGFLTRWSRRKREALSEKPATALPPETPAALPAQAPATGPSPAPEPEPEMIEPPSLDLVDKDFDVAHWLKQNVPESWKLAALRRAWESDPFIAGFENPACDYALEWNIPGGAPGYGPLTESDDVAAMVRGIFGETPKPEPGEEAVAEATGDSMPHQNVNYDESRSGDAAAQQETLGEAEASHVRLTNCEGPEPDDGQKMAKPSSDVYAAAQNSAPSDPPAVRIRKRGGGAIPL